MPSRLNLAVATETTEVTSRAYNAVVPMLQATLDQYDKLVIKDTEQLRNYITNKLIEISSCGTTKDELKALELLGKISDVGLFTEKTEIKVTHTTSAALEDTIKDKIGRLLAAKQQKVEEEEDIIDAEWAEEEGEGEGQWEEEEPDGG